MSPTPPLTETDHAGGERARSLSPSQSGRALLKTVDMNRFRNTAEQILNGLDESASPCFSIAMNKVESLLVTPRGDLLVCRDRISAAAFERESSFKTIHQLFKLKLLFIVRFFYFNFREVLKLP